MELIIAILYVLLFSVLIWKLKIFEIKCIKKTWVLAVFFAKIAAGLALTLIYTYYYSDGELSGDTAHYFNDGKILNQVFSESPKDYFTLLFSEGDQQLVETQLQNTEHWTRAEMDQFNDNRFIIRINSILSFFSLNSFYVHMLFFIMASMIGLTLFFKGIEDWIPKYQKEVFLLLFLFPSLLFWTSSVLKESLLIFGFGLLFYGFRFYSSRPVWKLAMILIGLFVLLNTKVYFLLCILPALAFYFLVQKSWKKNGVLFISMLILGVFFIWTNSYMESMNVTKYISQKQKDFNLVGKGGVYFMDNEHFYRIDFKNKEALHIAHNYVRLKQDLQVEVKDFGSQVYSRDSVLGKDMEFQFYSMQEPSQSYFKVKEIDNNWVHLVVYSPIYIANVFFMPFPWQSGSFLKWLNILENLFLFLLILFTLRYRKTGVLIDQKLFFFSLIFILLFYWIIGATTPVVGAIVRYKTPAFLIWILLFLSIIDFKRITLKPNKHKK
ncbi:MAG: hypothetical protein R2799_06140 [Crocinitomicaceae bacterium]